MTKRILLSGAGLLLMAAVAAPVLAQVSSPHTKTTTGLRKTMRLPDDPNIPAMADVTAETGPREFVESFLISMMREEPAAIYDSYLHPTFRSRVSRDVFADRMDEIMDVLGDIEKIGVAYLRQDNADETRPDRGRADYAMAFQRDPRVAMSVSFERTPDQHWKITSYNVTSAALDRFFRSRSAALAAEESGDEGSPESEPESPPDR